MSVIKAGIYIKKKEIFFSFSEDDRQGDKVNRVFK